MRVRPVRRLRLTTSIDPNTTAAQKASSSEPYGLPLLYASHQRLASVTAHAAAALLSSTVVTSLIRHLRDPLLQFSEWQPTSARQRQLAIRSLTPHQPTSNCLTRQPLLPQRTNAHSGTARRLPQPTLDSRRHARRSSSLCRRQSRTSRGRPATTATSRLLSVHCAALSAHSPHYSRNTLPSTIQPPSTAVSPSSPPSIASHRPPLCRLAIHHQRPYCPLSTPPLTSSSASLSRCRPTRQPMDFYSLVYNSCSPLRFPSPAATPTLCCYPPPSRCANCWPSRPRPTHRRFR